MESKNFNFSDIGSFDNSKSKNNFEIIALEILENAKQEQIKTLKKNEIYYLNKNYIIKKDEIRYKESINIYSINKDLSVNISAIVGKNGTGKSTIVELLFLAINNLAFFANKDLSVLDEPLEGINLYYKINNIVYKISFGDKKKYVYKFQDKKFILQATKEFSSNMDISQEFFYTIAVNYSQHSLNAKYIGPWLNNLFHKNDAYQTPIVIEPFRKDGNIDVNRQDELVKSRLLINLLEPVNVDMNFRKLTEYLEANSLQYELNSDKVQLVFNDIGFNIYGKKYIEKYLGLFFKLNEIEIQVDFTMNNCNIASNMAMLYIFKKLLNITLTYKQYKQYHYFDQSEGTYKFEKYEEYFLNIMDDKSHVTYKLRQAINFLKYNHIKSDEIKDIDQLSIDIAKLIENNPSEKIEFLLPPSFFKVKIILISKLNNETVLFDSLSSGEKQKIYSINSIMYHLSNINSVIDSFDKNLLTYKNINIILDEIELYFHPEMQREYVSYLIGMIELLKANGRLENIESLNFMFVTHSPFILSDIVQNNVLLLNKNGDNEKSSIANGTKTFGANIHDLLIDGFFISNSIGEYTKKKIDGIVEFFNNRQDNRHNGDYFKTRDEFIFIIDNLGEPYLKGILNSYIEDMDKFFNYQNIDNEIKELKEKLKKLETKKNNG